MWCVAELNEEYIARMEDVLKIYEKPLSEREPVVCVDEKPVVLHADVRPLRPMRPGHIARRDSEYARHGQRLLRCPAKGRAALYQTNREPLLTGVRRLLGADHSQLSGGRNHPSG